MTYQQPAEALVLQPPRTIQRVAQALGTLVSEDAEQGRPNGRQPSRKRHPAQGFFDLVVELGRFPADPAQHVESWWKELGRVLLAK